MKHNINLCDGERRKSMITNRFPFFLFYRYFISNNSRQACVTFFFVDIFSSSVPSVHDVTRLMRSITSNRSVSSYY